jgi:carbamoyltransferase
MGLAAYGQPSYLDAFRKLIRSGKEGRYELDLRYFDFVDGNRMYSEKLCALFGQPARKPETALTPFHKDVAKSLQNVLEEILLEKVEYLASRVNSRNLCLAGGIALNSVANGRIARESPFEHIFIQPAAGDAGACLGAAALAHIQLSGKRHTNDPLKHIHLGPSFSEARIAHLVAATGLPFVDYRNRERTLLEDVSDRLLEGKVIGWFQGAMEFGPRALGGRSIIANPMTTGIAEKINSLIKKRERFRPFAPTVLESEASKHFDLDHASPFMLETCRLISPLDLPGIRHVDGSSRPQTVDSNSLPIYRALLECFFQKSGCPILLNTSFNVRGEPIVCAPVDALLCMGKAPLDALVLGHFLIDRENLPENWSILVESWQQPVSAAFETTTNALKENLYSFV